MIEKLLLRYKELLNERKKALLELDGYKLESVLQQESRLLKELEKNLKDCSSLPANLVSLAEEVFSLHEEVAKLTFNMMEILSSEGKEDEHTINVQHG